MTTGLKRDTTDAFFTDQSVSKECISLFLRDIRPDKDDVIIEPSAGNGSFSTQITGFKHLFSYDIFPRHTSIISQDYLDFKTSKCYTDITSLLKPIHVIGNPPFGRQASLAKKFIKLSCEFASSISFILPKSFKKKSFQKTFSPYFHLVLEQNIPDNSFIINGQHHNVPCVFQIWKKQGTKRIEPEQKVSLIIEFCKKNDHPDFAIRRVGVYAGKLITENLDGLSSQSHYFCKTKGITLQEFQVLYQKIKYEHDNTVGPRSISKQEIIEKL